VILAAVVVGVVVFKESPDQDFTSTGAGKSAASTSVREAQSDLATSATRPQFKSVPRSEIVSTPLPADARLAVFAVSPDNGLIDFIADANGRVIQEVDKNPNSIGFKKPLRDYLYAGEKVAGLTAYQYFADHTEVTETFVSYKPDGSVDQLRESTKYLYPENKKR
jgi:hypothetical protein